MRSLKSMDPLLVVMAVVLMLCKFAHSQGYTCMFYTDSVRYLETVDGGNLAEPEAPKLF